MKLTTELLTKKQKALIISKTPHQFVNLLKDKLKQFDMNVFISPQLPHDISSYDACFFVQEPSMFVAEFVEQTNKKFVFIFFRQDQLAQTFSTFAQEHYAYHIKVINLDTSAQFFHEDIDTILWFAFSRSDEIFLQIYHPTFHHSVKPQKVLPKREKQPFSDRIKHFFTPKKMVLTGILLILITHTLFIPPLLITTFFNIQAGKALMERDFGKGKYYSERSKKFFTAGKALYNFARPTLLLFSLALYPEDLFQLNESTQNIISTSVSLQEKATILNQGLMQKDKTEAERIRFYAQKEELIQGFQQVHQDVLVLHAKIPTWTPQLQEVKDQLTNTLMTFDTVDKVIPQLDTLFGRDREKKYVLLFANNMELRPGGGFIGSFGIITLRDYAIHDLKIYDVYDADGQLTAHVEPPEAIKKYLDQPHWFLRDSAFSPDFLANYNQAKFFLDKELKITDLDGGILLTTTTIQNILEAVDELYIPDYQETVTKDNFYIKAQLHAEKDFFPGSLQKKRFLGSVMDQLLLNIGKTSFPTLAQMIKKSLDEKHMVMYMQNQQVQSVIDEVYWSGRTITPQCANPNKQNCVVDYFFPYDANLGVNKANFFISRPIFLDVKIGNDGKIQNKVTMRYHNESQNDVFPGGRYKNYLQVLLPPNVSVKQITNNNALIEHYDVKGGEFTTIGFLIEVQPQSTNEITIVYELPALLQKGDGTYQLIFQKQIGSQHSDLELKMTIPGNMYIVNKNFSPLVKGNEIIYNTSITSDKIFILDLFRE